MPALAVDQDLYQKAYAQLEGVQEPLRSIGAQIVAESGGAIGISSGFRTRAQQTKLYNDYINGVPGQARAARPGHSHHERGMAIDFSGDMGLLAKLAHKHGLFQPMDDEDWHYELGDGADYEGQGNLAFDVGDDQGSGVAQNPEDIIANRLTAVFSILGGSDGGGTAPMDQADLWGEVDAQMAEEMGIDPNSIFKSGVEGAADALTQGASMATKGSVAAYQKYALKQLLTKYGLDESQMPALIELWNRESNWNPDADNPTSTAAGIAQKLQSVNGPVENTWQGQIDWGLDYIMGRYGSPQAALQWHNRHNWY